MNSLHSQLRIKVISARAYTEERWIADQLANRLGLSTQAQLMRSLINKKAAELGVA